MIGCKVLRQAFHVGDGEDDRGWKDELMRAHRRMGDLFARTEARERSLAYLEGLLSGCERKNGWQVAECIGDALPVFAGPRTLGRRCAAGAAQRVCARQAGQPGCGSDS